MLVRRHLPTLSRFFRGKVDDLADIIQQTLTACVTVRDRVPADLEFRAYLLGVARNVLLHDLRRRQRKPAPAALDDHAHAHVERSTLSPSRRVAARDEKRLLLQALRRLPVDLQWLIELHYWEDMRQDEVAKILGVPPGTIKSRLHRAKNLLRTEISALAADPMLRASTLDNFEQWARDLAGARDDDDEPQHG